MSIESLHHVGGSRYIHPVGRDRGYTSTKGDNDDRQIKLLHNNRHRHTYVVLIIQMYLMLCNDVHVDTH